MKWEAVVPTHVGVNRVRRRWHGDCAGCPHARGGEPANLPAGEVGSGVVPTHVGVNRRRL